MFIFFFFFNDTATTEIYTLSLHDALPILAGIVAAEDGRHTVHVPRQEEIDAPIAVEVLRHGGVDGRELGRSEEHTSELQSRLHLVCRLLLEKKNRQTNSPPEEHRRGDVDA